MFFKGLVGHIPTTQSPETVVEVFNQRFWPSSVDSYYYYYHYYYYFYYYYCYYYYYFYYYYYYYYYYY